ncbi:MAG TPA: serine protease [Thermoanaerobaculia bacterium]|nr:serine protease [Thermoanaerobaculia bacterium]
MSDAQREPCPCCGEAVALSLKACPVCQESLLVDVVLAAPIAEPRARYGLAREISAFGPPALPFSTLQQSLGSDRPVLARSASRLAAHRLNERLAGLGLQADLTAVQAERKPPSRLRGLVTAGLGAAALLALLLGMRSKADPALPPLPRPAPRAAAVKGPDWPRTLTFQELSTLALPAVVNFHAAGGRLISGFLVAPGLALTRGAPTDAEVSKQDAGIGLALVSVPDSKAEPLELGDAVPLRGGDRLFFAVPTDRAPILLEGKLGAVSRQLQGVAYLSLEGNPPSGSDGGPVLDSQGRVVGLMAIQPDGAYVLPINYVYEESHLVEPPRPAPDAGKWADLLADVAAAERLRVDTPR